MSHTHLTEDKRIILENLLQQDYSQAEIARIVGVHRSTISNELRRNTPQRKGSRGRCPEYNAARAHKLAQERRYTGGRARISRQDFKIIKQLLRLYWSPEQISLTLQKMKILSVSHEWIYRKVREDKANGGDLFKYLRCQKLRRARYGRGARNPVRGRVSIDKRPAVVERRGRDGDLELDLVHLYGQPGFMLTAVDRRTRKLYVALIADKSAATVRDALIKMLAPIKDTLHTLTSDNGTEFAEHAAVAAALDVKFYFARPYASQQRGTNENTNGLLRQFFPKKGTPRKATPTRIAKAVDLINNRPRKCLDMKTPNELTSGLKPQILGVAFAS